MASASNAIVRLGLESNQYEKGLKQAQKQWQDFTKALGMNIGKLTAIGVAAGAVTGTMKVLKDAFFKNEAQLDEWGRTVESAKSVYSGFLNALNNGNISGFLSNINSIVQAARDAYDALDDLNTFNAFNQINFAEARSNLSGALADYKEGIGSKDAVKAAGDELMNLLKDRAEREKVAYETAVRNIAAQRGVNSDDLLNIMRNGNYDTLLQYKNMGLSGTYERTMDDDYGRELVITTKVAANEAERMGEVLRQLNDSEIKDLQALGAAAVNSAKEVNDTRRQIARYLGGGGTTTGGGGSASSAPTKEEYIPLAGSIDAQVQKVKELQDAFNAAGSDGIRMGLLPQLKDAEQTLERMRTIGDFMATSPTGIPGTELSPIAAPKLDDSEYEKAKALAEIAEKNRQAWMNAASAIGSVGQALQNIESPAAKVVGIIAEAVANVALAFASSLKGTFDPWEFIAGAAAGTATMVATIASIKQATAGSYATGGIVPGNNYQDGLMARVSSGELILNQAQQGTLASKLQQGSMLQNMHLEATLSGEDMRIAITNNLRRSGSGETINLRLQ